MAYKPKILTVPEGGSGVGTLTGVLTGNGTGTVTASAVTNHGVIVAGASNVLSTIAPGALGNVLKSDGTDWTSGTATSGGATAFQLVPEVTSSPVDSTTYFLSTRGGLIFTASGNAATRWYVSNSGTISQCYGICFVTGTLGTAENVTVAIRLNNTTDTSITTTLQMTGTSNAFNNTGLSIAVVAGDYIEFKMTTPAWATNPTGVFVNLTAITS